MAVSLISITGPSGTGKTTLAKNLLGILPGSRFLTSHTTRPRRETDLPGEYEYVSAEAFRQLEDAGEFLWTTSPHSEVRYGTRVEDIHRALEEGGVHVSILVPEVLTTLQAYAEKIGKADAVLFLYLAGVAEDELRRRLQVRGDAPEDIERRIGDRRAWDKQVQGLGIDFCTLDASLPPDEVAWNAAAIVRA